MIKNDLIQRLSETTDYTKKDAEIITGKFLDILKEALINGEDIELRGFGCFRIRLTPERPGRNPKTGEVAIVPSRFVVKFKKSKCWEIMGKY